MKKLRRLKIVKNIDINNLKDQGRKTFDNLNRIRKFADEFIVEIRDEAIPLIIEDFKIEFKLK